MSRKELRISCTINVLLIECYHLNFYFLLLLLFWVSAIDNDFIFLTTDSSFLVHDSHINLHMVMLIKLVFVDYCHYLNTTHWVMSCLTVAVKQVFKDLDFLGWYNTGELNYESDIQIHKQVTNGVNSSFVLLSATVLLQCFDTVGWVTGNASSPLKVLSLPQKLSGRPLQDPA